MESKKRFLLRYYIWFLNKLALILIIIGNISCGGGNTDYDNNDSNDNIPIINKAPVANDDLASTAEDTPVTINVLANDSDMDGDALSVASVTDPANGTVVNNGTDVSYIPDADYNGTDSFMYTVSDRNGGADSATVTVSVASAGEIILLEDNFPGYEENANWDDSWTMGIGSLDYYAIDPSFVRLLLDGPGVGGTYHNAEKKHRGATSGGFLYCDFEIRLRNSNNNGWDAPNAPNLPNSTYGLGSRGWGFWNDQMFIAGANIIWFTSISPESASVFHGTRVWIICDGTPVLMQDLGIDLTQWHIFRIQWRADYISIFVDDMINPIAEVSNPNNIPNEALAFTIWTDNYCFSGDMNNPIISYLSVPDIDQYIDVDYVKVYVSP